MIAGDPEEGGVKQIREGWLVVSGEPGRRGREAEEQGVCCGLGPLWAGASSR